MSRQAKINEFNALLEDFPDESDASRLTKLKEGDRVWFRLKDRTEFCRGIFREQLESHAVVEAELEDWMKQYLLPDGVLLIYYAKVITCLSPHDRSI